jgi:hypothetical protein
MIRFALLAALLAACIKYDDTPVRKDELIDMIHRYAAVVDDLQTQLVALNRAAGQLPERSYAYPPITHAVTHATTVIGELRQMIATAPQLAERDPASIGRITELDERQLAAGVTELRTDLDLIETELGWGPLQIAPVEPI